MATFDSIFPTFLAKCGELHTLLLSVAYALFVTGIIITVHHRFSHRVLLHLLVRILMLTSLLVFLPAWGNTIQNLLKDSILSGLGVDPSQVYQQFNQLLVIKRDPATQSSWWNVMAQLHNFTTDLIISAILWLVGWLASLLMFWGYVIQSVILNLGYALSPSGGAQVALQTAASAVSGAVAAAPLGPVAALAAGGAAGTAGLFSSSARIGNAGSLVSGLAGLGSSKNDASGDKAVRQLLSQLARHGLPPISPKS